MLGFLNLINKKQFQYPSSAPRRTAEILISTDASVAAPAAAAAASLSQSQNNEDARQRECSAGAAGGRRLAPCTGNEISVNVVSKSVHPSIACGHCRRRVAYRLADVGGCPTSPMMRLDAALGVATAEGDAMRMHRRGRGARHVSRDPSGVLNLRPRAETTEITFFLLVKGRVRSSSANGKGGLDTTYRHNVGLYRQHGDQSQEFKFP
ncbi:hypothetical protein TcasGA2_TC011136 [Tribolium castaneum]|uniref:Uncharacterized protein n=1 Tax=Tribolium castaneum TaxID=7070 RepID=D6X440_TRICA|nr:hypothetical protein TcasGA2_TC011136 [Tribolium castaneum]